MMRNLTLRALVVAAAIAAVPAVAAAQQQTGAATATPQTHTVVKGETLWGLAQQYLADPYRWREIYELNKDKVSDPHWIYPGQVLALPGAAAAAGAVTSVDISVVPAGTTPPVSVTPPDSSTPPIAGAPPVIATPPVVTTPPVDTTLPAAATPPADSATAPVPPPTVTEAVQLATSRTVFSKPVEEVRTPAKIDLKGPAMPTIRVGEAMRAPFVTKLGAMVGDGRLVKSADLDPQGKIDSRTIFKAYDRVMVALPGDVVANKGARFMVLRRDDALRGQGQIVVPTGVIEITEPSAKGVSAVAQVVELYGEMSPGQTLAPLDTAGLSTTVRPAPLSGGPWATIKWVLESPVLPTTQSYVVLDLTLADGVRPGDEFTVYRPLTPSTVPGGAGDPSIPIGRAQAIKVTAFGTTAIITSQQQAAIQVGSIVRLSAKMP